MTKNLDIINAAVSLIIKAALLAARFSGRVRKRSLKRLTSIDADAKDIGSFTDFCPKLQKRSGLTPNLNLSGSVWYVRVVRIGLLWHVSPSIYGTYLGPTADSVSRMSCFAVTA